MRPVHAMLLQEFPRRKLGPGVESSVNEPSPGHLHGRFLVTDNPAMSAPSSLRRSLRAVDAWTCSSCSRGLVGVARTPKINVVRARRWLNTSQGKRQGAAPTMDDIRAQYKEKNRTTMHAAQHALTPEAFANMLEGTMCLASSSAPWRSRTARCPCTRWYASLSYT